MQILRFAVLAMAMAGLGAHAATVKIVSPGKAQTYAYSSLTGSCFFWNQKEQTLYARLTFDNHLYASRTEPLDQESFVFAFPGVTFDAATNLYRATGADGQPVPVAERKKHLIGHVIVPLPGTVTFVNKRSGAVTVVLTVDTDHPQTRHWREHSDNWSLQNGLRDLHEGK
jgi:sugar lactone lactonase YvrE